MAPKHDSPQTVKPGAPLQGFFCAQTPPKRVVVWFSCGAASAVCAHLALKKFRGKTPVLLVYTDPGAEHPDNQRFLQDCQTALDHEILTLKSDRYKNPQQVFKARKFIVGPAGAPCTTELKKRLREQFQQPGDLQVFGFTHEEQNRANRFKTNNPEVKLWTPLIENMLSKADTLAYIQELGIQLPHLYSLGYKNNNCIGCVKGQAGYWNKIRQDFPDVFLATAKLERQIGAAICKSEPSKNGKRQRIPVFLDQLDPNAGNYQKEPDIECGLLCQIALTQ